MDIVEIDERISFLFQTVKKLLISEKEMIKKTLAEIESFEQSRDKTNHDS
jgi:hypothetical protein